MRWREFSLAELLWVVHTRTLQVLKEEKPHKVRLYLNQTKDYTALRAWDTAQIKESSKE